MYYTIENFENWNHLTIYSKTGTWLMEFNFCNMVLEDCTFDWRDSTVRILRNLFEGNDNALEWDNLIATLEKLDIKLQD